MLHGGNSVSRRGADGVAFLSLIVSAPPTQSEVEAIANKLDELIAALRR